MVKILLYLQKCYSPTVTTNKDGTNEIHRLKVLMDGDQLTVARARGAIRLRETHSADEKIDGFEPVLMH